MESKDKITIEATDGIIIIRMNPEKAFLEDYEKICNKHGMHFNCQGNIEKKKRK